MRRWLLLGVFALLALGCYAIGFGAGALIFLVLGAVAELLFWYKLLRRKP